MLVFQYFFFIIGAFNVVVELDEDCHRTQVLPVEGYVSVKVFFKECKRTPHKWKTWKWWNYKNKIRQNENKEKSKLKEDFFEVE